MCTYPWSNRDQFEFFSTCHVYQPVFIFFNALILFGSILNVIYGVRETRRRKRKDIPIFASLFGFFLGLSYIICLSANLSFANKNIGLNLIHSLGRCFMWVLINLYVARSLELVLVSDEELLSISSLLRYNLKLVFQYFLPWANVPIELLSFILPTVIPSLSLTSFVAVNSMSLSLINAIPNLYFTWRLVKLVANMKFSRDFYTPIQKKFEGVLYTGIFTLILSETLFIFYLVIPAIQRNLYIMYSIQMGMSTGVGLSYVYFTQEVNPGEMRGESTDMGSVVNLGSDVTSPTRDYLMEDTSQTELLAADTIGEPGKLEIEA